MSKLVSILSKPQKRLPITSPLQPKCKTKPGRTPDSKKCQQCVSARKKCKKSKTLESCQRCQQLGKLCSPRQKKASTNTLSGTFESNATQVLNSESIVSRSRKRNYSDTFGSPPSPLGIAEALLHLDGGLEYAREFEAQKGDGSSDVENGERTKFLYELMGYDKTQRQEYMRSRRTAREAAHPLSLDKAWRRYTESERDQAVKRVFEAYDYRYDYELCEKILRSMCQNNVKNINRKQGIATTTRETRSSKNDVASSLVSDVHFGEGVNNQQEVPGNNHGVALTYVHASSLLDDFSPRKLRKTRSGNNRYGNIGTLKCQHCRRLKSKCYYLSSDEPCDQCIKKHRPCGPKVLASSERQIESIEPEHQLNQQLEILSIEEPLLPQILKRLGYYKDSSLLQKLLCDELCQLISRPQYFIESRQDGVGTEADNTSSMIPMTSAHDSSTQPYSKSADDSFADSFTDTQKGIDPTPYTFSESAEFPPQSTLFPYPNPQDQLTPTAHEHIVQIAQQYQDSDTSEFLENLVASAPKDLITYIQQQAMNRLSQEQSFLT